MDTLSKLLDFNLISIGDYKVKVYSLVIILLILLITKVIVQLIKKALFRRYKGVHFDTGNTYALYQIIKYVIWVIAIGFILESVGIKLTLFLAGSAALLVGVGLGLQQTFNDIISGIILLSEKSIKINDILEIDGDIVEIQEIGLRTSRGLNRNDISIIIPNSLITTNKVINWSHQKKKTRFKIGVGVAYGSDVDLVVKILEESVLEHPDFEDGKTIEGRFVNFGNSSLDFEVLFFSENVFRIEKVKSDIRKIINRKFSENKIVIPFPQMDLHFKSGHTEIIPKNE
ncbi:Mechanosensitive ion channel [Arenibacter palladensis]|uniref:Mechanosensitive ion channel n=1 Tax=Arenibacter palladensis TaxID=237373 RepID=A0A1M5A675_9FLAO|nr:mechanosensitive ion channel domain-containing protein [Arenibacter palladensis]MDO6602520.1 mechanosensitive ion channel [Arenibacter palladensis]SHF25332.1 Mechanosensitive ion channel [Arenibacter palladensis]